MASLAVNLEELHEPSPEEINAARSAARALARLDSSSRPVSFVAQNESGEAQQEPISLPASIFRMIVKMLAEMGNGRAVAMVPFNAELTTQQAADLLNVSRPHLIKLINDGALSCRMVGTHRKLNGKEVLIYREKTAYARADGLKKMIALDEESGLYDDEQVGSKD
jgi:excisionase family DNA binding protein